jgi:hypothetical protein
MINQSILDLAYKIAKDAHTPALHTEAKDKLQSSFPTTPWDEIVDAYLKGAELAERCYEIADTARRDSIPDDRAIETLRERFPGFSDQTYNDALTRGWFLSR